MMPKTPRTEFAFAVLAGLACAACTASGDSANETAKPPAVAKTQKTGADLRFAGALRAPVAANGAGVLELTITEPYDDGALEIEAASEDLAIAASSKTFSAGLGGADQHRWDIYFDAGADGVFYIDLFAQVTDGRGQVKARSHSIAVPVGDGKRRTPVSDKLETGADGEPEIVMEAEETISD